MKISVVTVSYNAARTIADTIASVQAQDYPQVEHVIIDGASTDGTQAIIEEMADARTVFVSEPDRGLYDAMNKGIARASGDVIGVLNADDFYANDRVLGKVAGAMSDERIDGVYGNLQYVSATDVNRVIRHWKAGDFTVSELKRGWMPPHPTLYLQRSVFDRFGLYDTSFQIAADYDAILRFLSDGKTNIAQIPEILVKMRIGGESNRSLGRIIRKTVEDVRAARRNNVGGYGTVLLKNARKIGQFWGHGG